MNNYKLLSDKAVLEAAYMAKQLGEEENNFVKLLEIADEYKVAGLTPMFVLDPNTMNVGVYAKEMIGQKRH